MNWFSWPTTLTFSSRSHFTTRRASISSAMSWSQGQSYVRGCTSNFHTCKRKTLFGINFHHGCTSNFHTYKRKTPPLVCSSFATAWSLGLSPPSLVKNLKSEAGLLGRVLPARFQYKYKTRSLCLSLPLYLWT
jgi:hypothetical protein